MSRREKIEAMLRDEPRDEMLRYMLAMELDKEGQHDASLDVFRALRADRHVASFFMSAQQLARLGRIEESSAILREGIEEARRQGNSHAAGEMAEFLQSL